MVHGAKSARLVPSEHFEVSYTIGFDHPLLRHQSLALRVTPRSFTEQIAPARTFGFLREVELLRKSGLALGGSLENAVVIGETGVLNNKLRFEDEFVRHKILDAVGDLALLGHPLLGRFEATRAGHALHAAVATKLLATPGAFELVPAAAVPAPEPAALVPGAAPCDAGARAPKPSENAAPSFDRFLVRLAPRLLDRRAHLDRQQRRLGVVRPHEHLPLQLAGVASRLERDRGAGSSRPPRAASWR